MKFIKQIHEHIKLCKSTNLPLKLEVGANKNAIEEGWIKVKKNVLDITSKDSWFDTFDRSRTKKSVTDHCEFDNIFAEHCLEHLTLNQARQAIENFCLFLKINGVIRIAVPDGYHKDKIYIDWVRPHNEDEKFDHPWGNSTKSGVYDHKVIYNWESLSLLLLGYKLKLKYLEWWDDNEFYCEYYDDNNGYVRRSFRHDERNDNGEPVYTSLVIDATKLD